MSRMAIELQAAPAAGGEALLRLEDDAVALHAMQHAAAVGTDPDADMARVSGVPSSNGVALFRRAGHRQPVGRSGLSRTARAQARRLKASTSKGGILAAEALALHAPEEAPAVVRAGAPFVADVVGGPVLHHDTSPGKRSPVYSVVGKRRLLRSPKPAVARARGRRRP